MIKLDNNYTIESDSYNWILRFEEVKQGFDKEGNTKEILSTKESYHATFTQAIKTYIDETLKSCTELDQILVKLKEIEIKVDNLNIKRNDIG